MSNNRPIFYSALLLTGVNLILRFAGTSFQIFISNRIGPSGVGLLQLVMSVGSMAMIAGIAGIRTAAMYLTAEELGKNKPENISPVLSACILYSILCSGTVAVLLTCLSPMISDRWIGHSETVNCLRLYAGFLPAACLCGVMTGYFTAAGKIGTLTIVEVIEQVFTMAVTLALLFVWAGKDPAKACQSVIFGSSLGCILTLLSLIFLRTKEHASNSFHIPIRNRLLSAAVPLAAADILKAGINTVENLMVPIRLKRNYAVADPLAAFGTVSGMVFPVIMFPACILFALAELLIPELARCNAAIQQTRIAYLVKRGFKVTLLYGLFFGGLIFLIAEPLCVKLYGNPDASSFLMLYALLIPILYCDAIVDAMTKGLGQQKVCVRYNIITALMDVLLLYLVLPTYGMRGYYFSFTVTHLINFILSYLRLIKITGVHIPFYLPAFSLASAAMATALASVLSDTSVRAIAYPFLLCSLLILFGVLKTEDYLWLKGLCKGTQYANRKASRYNRLA